MHTVGHLATLDHLNRTTLHKVVDCCEPTKHLFTAKFCYGRNVKLRMIDIPHTVSISKLELSKFQSMLNAWFCQPSPIPPFAVSLDLGATCRNPATRWLVMRKGRKILQAYFHVFWACQCDFSQLPITQNKPGASYTLAKIKFIAVERHLCSIHVLSPWGQRQSSLCQLRLRQFGKLRVPITGCHKGNFNHLFPAFLQHGKQESSNQLRLFCKPWLRWSP